MSNDIEERRNDCTYIITQWFFRIPRQHRHVPGSLPDAPQAMKAVKAQILQRPYSWAKHGNNLRQLLQFLGEAFTEQRLNSLAQLDRYMTMGSTQGGKPEIDCLRSLEGESHSVLEALIAQLGELRLQLINIGTEDVGHNHSLIGFEQIAPSAFLLIAQVIKVQSLGYFETQSKKLVEASFVRLKIAGFQGARKAVCLFASIRDAEVRQSTHMQLFITRTILCI